MQACCCCGQLCLCYCTAAGVHRHLLATNFGEERSLVRACGIWRVAEMETEGPLKTKMEELKALSAKEDRDGIDGLFFKGGD